MSNRKPGEIKIIEAAGVLFEMVWCPPGEFVMGSPLGEPQRHEGYQHKVTFTTGFWLGQTAVTQAQWKAIMGFVPFIDGYSRQIRGDKKPVVYISWNDAQEFIKKLNQILIGYDFRLPYEAEWEYACRAGTTDRFYFGDRITTDQVNYDGDYPPKGSPKGKYRKGTVDVKSLPGNNWGLYEMHGNVWEWCQESFYSYSQDDQVDPKGPVNGWQSILRGGAWNFPGYQASSSHRATQGRNEHDSGNGFRLARDP